MSKWILRAAGALIALSLAASAGFFVGAQNGEAKPARTLKANQVARVAGEIITAEDLIDRLFDVERNVEPRSRILLPAVEYLQHVKLLELEAARIGCEIKQAEVDSVVNTQIAAAKKQLKDRFDDAYTWEKWLGDSGFTEVEFKKYMQKRARVVLLKRFVVTYHFEREDSMDASLIIVAKEETAKDVHDQLKKGAKFEDLAVKFSQDPGTAQRGGKLPPYFRGDGMERPLEEALWALKDGEYSKPIETDAGWQIVKRHKIFPGNKAPFFDRRAELLARADIPEEGFTRWAHCVLWTGDYKTERRLPGLDAEPNQP